MHKFILIILLFALSAFEIQLQKSNSFKTQKKGSLVVTINYCDTMINYDYHIDIAIYGSQGYLKKKLIHVRGISPEYKLPPGKYVAKFRSAYGKKCSIPFKIAVNSLTNIEICPYEIDYSSIKYTPIIDKLKDGEDYVLIYHLFGCFKYQIDSVKIKRINQLYYATKNDSTIILTNNEVNQFREFELEAFSYITHGGSTTSTIVRTIYNGEKDTLIDVDDGWRGKSRIIWKLWPKK